MWFCENQKCLSEGSSRPSEVHESHVSLHLRTLPDVTRMCRSVVMSRDQTTYYPVIFSIPRVSRN